MPSFGGLFYLAAECEKLADVGITFSFRAVSDELIEQANTGNGHVDLADDTWHLLPAPRSIFDELAVSLDALVNMCPSLFSAAGAFEGVRMCILRTNGQAVWFATPGWAWTMPEYTARKLKPRMPSLDMRLRPAKPRADSAVTYPA